MRKAFRPSVFLSALTLSFIASVAGASHASAAELDPSLDFLETGVKFVVSCGTGANVAMDEIYAQLMPAASWIRHFPIDGAPNFLANDQYGLVGKTRSERYADYSVAALGSLLGPVAEAGLDLASYANAWVADGTDYLQHGKITQEHPHARLFSATEASYKYMIKTLNDYVFSDSTACQQARSHLVVLLSQAAEKASIPVVAHSDESQKRSDLVYVTSVEDRKMAISAGAHKAD